nr:plasmid mobilization relaxosome protein MobC [Martelella limonii]
MLLRETLGLVSASRRRPVPAAAPELLAALSRIGGNLNQIARWLNTAEARGDVARIDAIAVAAGLVGVERALSEALAQNARKGDRPC